MAPVQLKMTRKRASEPRIYKESFYLFEEAAATPAPAFLVLLQTPYVQLPISFVGLVGFILREQCQVNHPASDTL